MTGTRSRRASTAAAYMTCDVETKLMKSVHSLLLAQLKPRLGMRHLAMLVRTSVAISSQQAVLSTSLAIGPQDDFHEFTQGNVLGFWMFVQRTSILRVSKHDLVQGFASFWRLDFLFRSKKCPKVTKTAAQLRALSASVHRADPTPPHGVEKESQMMLQHKQTSSKAASLHGSSEDFLARLDKAEARDGNTRQQHIAFQRSQREPIWTQKASQPVGGRFQRNFKFNKERHEQWTPECEAAFRMAFGKSSDRSRHEGDAPTGA